LLQHIAPQMAKRVRKLARAAQDSGRMNPALDPRLVIVSVIGLTLLPLAAAPIWQQLPGYQSISVERMAGHMLELLAHGLENNTGAKPAATRPRVRKPAAKSSKTTRARAAESPSAGEKSHARTD
jgi:hypothetical protein